MSQKNARAFFGEIEGNEGLRGPYQSLVKGIATLDKENALKEMVQFASQSGYEFASEDLELVLESMKSELSDEELDAVAGGGGLIFPYWEVGDTL